MHIETIYPTSITKEETNELVEKFQRYKGLKSEVGGWLSDRLGRPTTLPEIMGEIQSDIELSAVQEAGLEAFDRLYAGHFSLIPRFARKYLDRGLEYEDLFQEGSIGLLRSIEDYDPKKGAFSTHAADWIEHYVSRAVQDQGLLIRLPVHIHDILGTIGRFVQSFTQEVQRPPTLEEITNALRGKLPDPPPISLIPERIREILDSARRPFYLSEPIPQHEDITLADVIPSSTDLEDQIKLPSNIQSVKAIIETEVRLNPREREIFFLLEGLEDGKRWTSKEVETKLGVTQQNVSQFRTSARNKIRENGRLKAMYEEV